MEIIYCLGPKLGLRETEDSDTGILDVTRISGSIVSFGCIIIQRCRKDLTNTSEGRMVGQGLVEAPFGRKRETVYLQTFESLNSDVLPVDIGIVVLHRVTRPGLPTPHSMRTTYVS